MPIVQPRIADTWLSAAAVARLIPADFKHIQPMCEAGGVRILRRPGMPLRFHREDVEALAVKCGVGAEATASA